MDGLHKRQKELRKTPHYLLTKEKKVELNEITNQIAMGGKSKITSTSMSKGTGTSTSKGTSMSKGTSTSTSKGTGTSTSMSKIKDKRRATIRLPKDIDEDLKAAGEISKIMGKYDISAENVIVDIPKIMKKYRVNTDHAVKIFKMNKYDISAENVIVDIPKIMKKYRLNFDRAVKIFKIMEEYNVSSDHAFEIFKITEEYEDVSSDHAFEIFKITEEYEDVSSDHAVEIFKITEEYDVSTDHAFEIFKIMEEHEDVSSDHAFEIFKITEEYDVSTDHAVEILEIMDKHNVNIDTAVKMKSAGDDMAKINVTYMYYDLDEGRLAILSDFGHYKFFNISKNNNVYFQTYIFKGNYYENNENVHSIIYYSNHIKPIMNVLNKYKISKKELKKYIPKKYLNEITPAKPIDLWKIPPPKTTKSRKSTGLWKIPSGSNSSGSRKKSSSNGSKIHTNVNDVSKQKTPRTRRNSTTLA